LISYIFTYIQNKEYLLPCLIFFKITLKLFIIETHHQKPNNR